MRLLALVDSVALNEKIAIGRNEGEKEMNVLLDWQKRLGASVSITC